MNLACRRSISDNAIQGPGATWSSGTLLPSIETTVEYSVKMMKKIQHDNIRSIAVKQDALNDIYAHFDEYHKTTVFQEECRSWFKDGKIKNRIYLWPGPVSAVATDCKQHMCTGIEANPRSAINQTAGGVTPLPPPTTPQALLPSSPDGVSCDADAATSAAAGTSVGCALTSADTMSNDSLSLHPSLYRANPWRHRPSTSSRRSRIPDSKTTISGGDTGTDLPSWARARSRPTRQRTCSAYRRTCETAITSGMWNRGIGYGYCYETFSLRRRHRPIMYTQAYLPLAREDSEQDGTGVVMRDDGRGGSGSEGEGHRCISDNVYRKQRYETQCEVLKVLD